MANVTKINSGKGVVSFSQQDLIEHNLLRYVRTSFKGIGKKGLLTDHPFESVASDLYKAKYPSDQIKIAEKCILKDDDSVDVILRVSEEHFDEMYNTHPTKRVFKKEEQKRAE